MQICSTFYMKNNSWAYKLQNQQHGTKLFRKLGLFCSCSTQASMCIFAICKAFVYWNKSRFRGNIAIQGYFSSGPKHNRMQRMTKMIIELSHQTERHSGYNADVLWQGLQLWCFLCLSNTGVGHWNIWRYPIKPLWSHQACSRKYCTTSLEWDYIS